MSVASPGRGILDFSSTPLFAGVQWCRGCNTKYPYLVLVQSFMHVHQLFLKIFISVVACSCSYNVTFKLLLLYIWVIYSVLQIHSNVNMTLFFPKFSFLVYLRYIYKRERSKSVGSSKWWRRSRIKWKGETSSMVSLLRLKVLCDWTPQRCVIERNMSRGGSHTQDDIYLKHGLTETFLYFFLAADSNEWRNEHMEWMNEKRSRDRSATQHSRTEGKVSLR